MATAGAEFGERLRAEREQRGITLEVLCARTKVNLRHLEALERGDYKVLPGGIIRRGFVRAYLGSVGLEEGSWLEQFDSSYADFARSVGGGLEPAADGWVAFAVNVKRNRGASSPAYVKQWLTVLAMLLALLAATWAVWHFMLQARVRP